MTIYSSNLPTHELATPGLQERYFPDMTVPGINLNTDQSQGLYMALPMWERSGLRMYDVFNHKTGTFPISYSGFTNGDSNIFWNDCWFNTSYCNFGTQVIDITKGWSMSTWIRSTYSTGDTQYLFSVGGLTGFSVYLNYSTSTLSAASVAITAQYVVGVGYLPVTWIIYGDWTKWRHIAITGNGPYLSLYIDGVFQNTSPVSSITNPTVQTGQLLIGGGNTTSISYGAYDYSFCGYMKDFRLYKRQLEAGEVARIQKTPEDLYESPLAVKQATFTNVSTIHLTANMYVEANMNVDTNAIRPLAYLDIDSAMSATMSTAIKETAAINVTSNLNAVVFKNINETAALTATSTLTATPKIINSLSAGIVAGSTMSASPTVIKQMAANIVVGSTLSATPILIKNPTSNIVVTSTLAATPTIKYYLTANMVAGSAMTATPAPEKAIFSASIVATSQMTAKAQAMLKANIVAGSTLSATATKITVLPMTASMVASSTMSAGEIDGLASRANIVATSAMTATPILKKLTTASVVASSTMNATPTIKYYLTANMVAGSAMTATPAPEKAIFSASIVATSTMTAKAQALLTASMVAGSTLSATATKITVLPMTASMVASSTMSAGEIDGLASRANIVATSTMTASPKVKLLLTANMVAGSTLSANIFRKINSSANMIATSNFVAKMKNYQTVTTPLVLQIQPWLEPQLTCKLYPLTFPYFPNSIGLPSVNYTRTDSDLEYYLDGCKGHRVTRISFAVYAANVDDAITIGQQINDVLDGYQGLIGDCVIYACNVVNVSDEYHFTEEGDNSQGIIRTVEVEMMHSHQSNVPYWVYTDETSLYNQVYTVWQPTFSADITDVYPLVKIQRMGMENENYLSSNRTFSTNKYHVSVVSQNFEQSVTLAESIRLKLGYYVEHEHDTFDFDTAGNQLYITTLELECIKV